MASLATWNRKTGSNSWKDRPLPLTTCGLPHSLLKIWLVCPPHLVVLERKIRTQAGLKPFRSCPGFSPIDWWHLLFSLVLVSECLFQKDSCNESKSCFICWLCSLHIVKINYKQHYPPFHWLYCIVSLYKWPQWGCFIQVRGRLGIGAIRQSGGLEAMVSGHLDSPAAVGSQAGTC